MEICKICKEKFEYTAAFTRHLKKEHATNPKQYYGKYYPKKDLLTGELIEFKDKEEYFLLPFASRGNLRKWLKKTDDEEAARKVILDFYRHRIEKKGLLNSMSQVELKSLNFAPKELIYRFFRTDWELVHKLNVKERFHVSVKNRPNVKPNIQIAIDSRENTPLTFDNYETTNTKLDYGDYVPLGDNFHNIFFERKSDSDFVSSLGKGFPRIKEEIERAAQFDAYIVFIVERPLSVMLNFQFTYLKRFVKATPAFIFNNVRTLMQENDNVQFLFLKDREECEKAILATSSLGEKAKNIDLQYAYDRGNLI